MKKICFVFLSFIISICALAQDRTLKLLDSDNKPVEYASIYDLEHKQHIFSDENGIAHLEYDYQQLEISRMGYFDTIIKVSLAEGEAFTLTLSTKANALEEVTIQTKLDFYKKEFEEGAYHHKSRNSHAVHQKQPIKYGALIPFNQNIERTKYLTGLKFKMRKVNKYLKDDFILVVNIYQVLGNEISKEPINRDPILIKSSTLKTNNNISFPKPVALKGKASALVTFEIPQIGIPDSKNTLVFFSNATAQACRLYRAANFKKGWPSSLSSMSPSRDPLFKGYDELAVSLTYRILED